MRQPDFQALAQWIQSLTGPGVLVVGQPLFNDKAGRLYGTFADWNLADYRQYHPLAQLLTQCPHSIVILTGDVHYGRIAWCPLTSGGELIEVISSPMSLVDRQAEGSWDRAPDLFPPYALPGVPRAPVYTLGSQVFSPVGSHFLTLEFSATGAGARMSVRFWPIGRQASGRVIGVGDTVFQRFLH
jgi:hypothetical protein